MLIGLMGNFYKRYAFRIRIPSYEVHDMEQFKKPDI